MEPLKAVIIEDEELARELIKNYLKDNPAVEIIRECDNGFDGVKAIAELNPDLIFLDIQMPKLNGFEMLELVENPPETVFITAHNEFAIKAFERNAVDYLLKPYSKDRLLRALDKAVDRIRNRVPAASYMKNLIQAPITDKLERVVVKSGTKIRVIPVEKILYLEAQDDYVMIYTAEGKHLKQATMKYFEDNLDPSVFIRVHRSYIVHVDQVTQLEPYSRDNFILKLKNGTSLRVSRSGLKSLKDRLSF